jgi:hypothetical protein
MKKLCAVSRLATRVTRYGARMSRGNLILSIGIAALALTGCASNSSNVTTVGNEAYHLSVTGERYETQADTNYKALNVANDFCAKKSQHLMFRQSTETSEHSWSAKQEDLTFVCMDANDPAYMKAAAERPSPVVAQQPPQQE